MKTANDFRASFGAPDDSFVSAVHTTLNKLSGQEKDAVPQSLPTDLMESYQKREVQNAPAVIKKAPRKHVFAWAALLTVLCAVGLLMTAFRPSSVPDPTATGLVPLQQSGTAVSALPSVYLTVDEDALWNAESGLLTEGDRIDKSSFPFRNALYKENGSIPRDCHVVIHNIYGEAILDTDAAVSLAVNDIEVDMSQKPFILTGDFKVEGMPEYQSFTLTNGGMDSTFTQILSGYNAQLTEAAGCSFMHLRGQPVSVYLNGEYWGHYNLAEKADTETIAIHESLESNEGITILYPDGNLVEGSEEDRAEYLALLATVKSLNPAEDPEDLDYILRRVDVDNYLEYIAMQMFVGNSDTSEFLCYKVPGGKWKWLWQKVDYGLFNSGFDSPKSYLKKEGAGVLNTNNSILRKLLSVPAYKEQFLSRLGGIFQTLTTDKMLEILEPMVDEIAPEMPRHFDRWAEEAELAVNPEQPTDPQEALAYWNKRIERLRNTLRKRPTLLWEYIQTAFELTEDQMITYFGPKPEMPADAIL